MRTCYALAENGNNYISWNPRVFEKEGAFPDTVGCVDVCEIAMNAPNIDPNSYFNRKGFHSMKLQAICDKEMRFMDILAGYCGSMHDARVWNLSGILGKLQNHTRAYLPNNTHILGDGAYPLSSHLMKPFRDNGFLTDEQNYFNVKHAKTRCVIERAFALLLCRWRRLKYLHMNVTELKPLFIYAACILHKICLKNNDDLDHLEDDVRVFLEEHIEDVIAEQANEVEALEVRADGVPKRNVIARNLYARRHLN